jgi:hypothetical protein
VNFARPDGRVLGLVYLFKQGRFYPFAPRLGAGSQGASGRDVAVAGAGQGRDTMLELQVRDLLSPELPMEPELSRWFPIWGAPGLS